MAYLKSLRINWEQVEDKNTYPFNVPALAKCQTLDFNQNVTFFIGENGSGKSTLLEAIAYQCGFGVGGGDRNYDIGLSDESLSLASILTLAWMPKINKGFFLRAETFFDFAQFLDERAKDPFSGGGMVYNTFGGKSLNEQSHGEAFLSLFTNRFGGKSIFLLDEPEAALSPQRQLAFLRIMHDLEKEGAQFIIATHSPILMAYPGARIYEFDEDGINPIDYETTDHYRLTKSVLSNPERYFRELFD